MLCTAIYQGFLVSDAKDNDNTMPDFLIVGDMIFFYFCCFFSTKVVDALTGLSYMSTAAMRKH